MVGRRQRPRNHNYPRQRDKNIIALFTYEKKFLLPVPIGHCWRLDCRLKSVVSSHRRETKPTRPQQQCRQPSFKLTTNWIDHISMKSSRSVLNKVSEQSPGDALLTKGDDQGYKRSELCRSVIVQGCYCGDLAVGQQTGSIISSL